MCGLTLCVTRDDFGPLFASLCDEDRRRGPDTSGVYGTRVGDLSVSLASSVLGLRGTLTPQPMMGKNGVLAWNGQVFDPQIPVEDNDTRKLFDKLESGVSPDEVFATIEGPFAYVYINFRQNTIHFGVDPLSRRSLLIHYPSSRFPSFILTSSRSRYAREQGLDMVALNGGQCGVLDLENIDLSDMSLTMRTIQPLSPVNSNVTPTCDQVEIFIEKLTESVRRRVANIPKRDGPRVALLFSGGVDCTLLAALASRILPPGEPIELINVAFENARKDNSPASYDVPDRISGREACAELRETCHREFRFVEVNVTLEESRTYRERVIDLMYPSNTEMDVSLAYPLFFASRGVGTVDGEAYIAQARVYISGLGADEQLGGYTRHRRAYDRGGLPDLISELQLDIDRLPTRNLSRDDRVISAHGREARYPYLDLSFVQYLSSLPVVNKCDLTLPPGIGDKALLRNAAAALGLVRTSRRVKRAMQFGTKSAKLNVGAKGHRVGEGLIAELR